LSCTEEKMRTDLIPFKRLTLFRPVALPLVAD
jgi:hypothetical protein